MRTWTAALNFLDRVVYHNASSARLASHWRLPRQLPILSTFAFQAPPPTRYIDLSSGTKCFCFSNLQTTFYTADSPFKTIKVKPVAAGCTNFGAVRPRDPCRRPSLKTADAWRCRCRDLREEPLLTSRFSAENSLLSSTLPLCYFAPLPPCHLATLPLCHLATCHLTNDDRWRC